MNFSTAKSLFSCLSLPTKQPSISCTCHLPRPLLLTKTRAVGCLEHVPAPENGERGERRRRRKEVNSMTCITAVSSWRSWKIRFPAQFHTLFCCCCCVQMSGGKVTVLVNPYRGNQVKIHCCFMFPCADSLVLGRFPLILSSRFGEGKVLQNHVHCSFTQH